MDYSFVSSRVMNLINQKPRRIQKLYNLIDADVDGAHIRIPSFTSSAGITSIRWKKAAYMQLNHLSKVKNQKKDSL